MHARRDQLPVTFDGDGITFRGEDWGAMRVTVNSWPAGLDAAPFLAGFPDHRCPCPHWGYVVNGKMRVTSSDGEETFATGDVYYLPPGHTLVVEEDIELVEFSPVDQMAALGGALRKAVADAAQ